MDWPGCCCHAWPPELQHNIEGCLPSKLNLQHSSYLTDKTVNVHYKSKLVSAVHKKNPHNLGNKCGYCENYVRHKYTIWENNSVSYMLQQIVCVDIPQFGKVNTLGTGYLNCLYAYKHKSASPVLNVLSLLCFNNNVSMPSKFPPLQWGSKEINQWNLVIVVIIITTTITITINCHVT
jgi:hypothetical protein